MGVVYLARDAGLARDVAVKVLAHTDQEAFFAEARITAQLQHPGVVPVYALGRVAGGDAPLIAMQRVEGQTWQAMIRTDPPGGRPGALLHHLRILQRVLEACAYAHDQGFIHRDLKPANVMVGTFGRVFLLDWGLAVAESEADSVEPAGTPAYMAPEMADAQPLTRATDVYLLGAILFELLTGRAPHTKPSAMRALISAVLNEVLPIEPRVPTPPGLLEVASTCLATDPTQRYATAQELSEALERVLSGEEQREESHELTQQAGARFAASGAPDESDLYGELFEIDGLVQQALQLWPVNEEALALQTTLFLALAERALSARDFGMASSFARRAGGRGAEIEDLQARIETGKREFDPESLAELQSARGRAMLAAGLGTLVSYCTLLLLGMSLATRPASIFAGHVLGVPIGHVLLFMIVAWMGLQTAQLLLARGLLPTSARARYKALLVVTLMVTGTVGGAAALLGVADVAAGVENRLQWAMFSLIFAAANMGVVSGLFRPRIRALFPQ